MSPPSPPTPASRSPRSRSAVACSSPICAPDGPRAGGRRAGVRSPARTRRRSRVAYVQRRAVVRRRARRRGARAGRRRRRAGHGHVGQRRLHRRRGDAAAAGLLVVARRRDDRRLPQSTWRRSRCGTSPTRPIPAPRPSQCATRPPARANPDVTLHVCTLDGSPPPRSRGTATRSLSRRRALDRARVDRDCSVPRSTPCRGRRGRHGHRRDFDGVRRCRRGVGRARAEHRRDGGRRHARHGADRDGARRLMVNGEPVTPVDLQVRHVISVESGPRGRGRQPRRRRHRATHLSGGIAAASSRSRPAPASTAPWRVATSW